MNMIYISTVERLKHRGVKMKDCGNCFYNLGDKCKVLKDKQIDCWAWADEKQAKKTEEEIAKYEEIFVRSKTFDTTARNMSRRQASIQETMDKQFLKLYEKGLDDVEIGERLNVSRSSVRRFRTTKYNLLPNGRQGLKRKAKVK